MALQPLAVQPLIMVFRFLMRILQALMMKFRLLSMACHPSEGYPAFSCRLS